MPDTSKTLSKGGSVKGATGSPALADFAIVAEGTTWWVHKSVLCAKSDWFMRKCQELGDDNTIHGLGHRIERLNRLSKILNWPALPLESIETVDLLLNYCYTGTYHIPSEQEESELEVHVAVFYAAVVFECASLREFALSNVTSFVYNNPENSDFRLQDIFVAVSANELPAHSEAVNQLRFALIAAKVRSLVDHFKQDLALANAIMLDDAGMEGALPYLLQHVFVPVGEKVKKTCSQCGSTTSELTSVMGLKNEEGHCPVCGGKAKGMKTISTQVLMTVSTKNLRPGFGR